MERTNAGIKTSRAPGLLRKLLDAQEITVILPFIVLCAVATALNPVFVSPGNLVSITRLMVLYGFLAIGETFIIIVDEIDISIGSMVAFGAMFFAYLIAEVQLFWWAALLLLLMLTVGLSLINALCVVKLKMPAFIVTIAMLYVCKGGARALTFAKPINILDAPGGGGLIQLGQSPVLGGLGWGFVTFVICVVVAQLVLKKTAYGRRVYATGDSLSAARISGINTDKIKISTFLISGVMVALTSMFLVGREASANPNSGDGWEMQIVAACAIGGVSMIGGAGSIVGTFFGVAMMAAIQNMLNMLAVNSNWQSIVVGTIIVAAVIFDVIRRQRKFGSQS
jgi:ribose transport system permease protein